jgi:hypothetical protein
MPRPQRQIPKRLHHFGKCIRPRTRRGRRSLRPYGLYQAVSRFIYGRHVPLWHHNQQPAREDHLHARLHHADHAKRKPGGQAFITWLDSVVTAYDPGGKGANVTLKIKPGICTRNFSRAVPGASSRTGRISFFIIPVITKPKTTAAATPARALRWGILNLERACPLVPKL